MNVKPLMEAVTRSVSTLRDPTTAAALKASSFCLMDKTVKVRNYLHAVLANACGDSTEECILLSLGEREGGREIEGREGDRGEGGRERGWRKIEGEGGR